jgi:hypothetical protein
MLGHIYSLSQPTILRVKWIGKIFSRKGAKAQSAAAFLSHAHRLCFDNHCVTNACVKTTPALSCNRFNRSAISHARWNPLARPIRRLTWTFLFTIRIASPYALTAANRCVELSLLFSSERTNENAAACTRRLRASHSAIQFFTVVAVSRSR